MVLVKSIKTQEVAQDVPRIMKATSAAAAAAAAAAIFGLALQCLIHKVDQDAKICRPCAKKTIS
jgi:hypothetical protein